MRGPSARPAIVCWGETVWDEIAGREPSLGGVACSVATHLQLLGASPRLVSAVGADAHGEGAFRELEQRAVDTRWLLVVADGQTARVRVELDSSGPRYSALARLDWSLVHFDAALAQAVVAADALVFALFMQGTTVPLAALDRALASHHRPRLVGCDLNLRHTTSRETIEKALTLVDFVKLNDVELRRLIDLYRTPDAASLLLQRKSNLAFVVETRGSQGARLIQRGRTTEVPAPLSAPPRHSVGAGDALMAAFVYALVSGDPPERALEEAVRYASQHVALNVRR
ncbi:MAG TPA: carbohydrate kinase family protein [Polyangiaceae bacterium]|nr:carbohydrate kinase family protein [Polyangiaceae bacterium]